MNKISALWALFRKGEAVSDPAAWKNGTITINALAALVLAVGAFAESFGLDLGLSDDLAAQIGGGALALGNIIMHVITSQKIGLPARSGGNDVGTAAGAGVVGADRRPFFNGEM